MPVSTTDKIFSGSIPEVYDRFLVPLIFGITILTMVVTAAISLSPTDAELRKENEAIARIAGQFSGHLGLGPRDGQAGYLP